LKLKCTKFDFGCGAPQTPLRELTPLPQTSWLDLRRPGLLLQEGREGQEREEVGGEVGGKERVSPPNLKTKLRP